MIGGYDVSVNDDVPGRYDGRPFLKIVDSYIMWIIGALDADAEGVLERLAPKLGSVYGTDGSWQEIVATQLELPENFSEVVRSRWKLDRLTNPDPVSWSHQVADKLIS